MSPPRIHCLLPPKEKFGPEGAGAQALKIVQSSRNSRHRTNITVFGRSVAEPFRDVAFQPLDLHWPMLFGANMGLARAYARAVGSAPPDMIECFNRPAVAKWLARRFPKVPVTVYFGNDPQTMLGSRTPRERKVLVERLAGIYFISEYLYGRFIEGLGSVPPNVGMLQTGIERTCTSPPVKEPTIVFVGRVEPIKGALELTEALARVLPRHPEWKAFIIGARWFESGVPASPYEEKVKVAAARCDRIQVTGFLPNIQVRDHLRRAAIAAVPSNWDEPFGRTALEALAEGCAVIATKRGGLAEIGHRACFLREVTADEIERVLEELISNDAERARLQHVAWSDFPFTMDAFAGQWDAYRDALTSRG